MLEHLFGSNTRLELLRLFVKNPNKIYFVRELTRTLDVQINATRRELNLLKKVGIVEEKEKPEGLNNSEPGVALRKYYGVNQESPLYEEIRDLLLKEQLLNEQRLVERIVDKAGDVKLFLVTGSLTSVEAPTDLLVVGDIESGSIKEMINEHENDLDFDVRYTIMEEEEFLERYHIMDKFLYSIFQSKHVKMVNELDI